MASCCTTLCCIACSHAHGKIYSDAPVTLTEYWPHVC
uniref:Uncharacterized protein n=1 Tax=Anguilla anguilla TaxID=7936 RepID=A0A0E9SFZ8_ANGAN